jgi:spermidine synthase
MTLDEKKWFTEQAEEAGTAFSLRIHDRVHHERSAYQTIDVYETTKFGRLMVIDGYVMLSDRDNFLYHEMMTHPALYTHAAPKRIAIIGGGDCGSLTEVLRHPEVESAVQIEIDERVTRVAEQWFPDLCKGTSDPRAKLHFEDGIEWMKQAPADGLDVIIVDSTDPIGPAEGLFNTAFYTQCHRALAAGGILVQQSESPLLHLDLIRDMRACMAEAGFPARATLTFPQPVYPSGWWSATMARKNANLNGFRETAAEKRPFETRYYSVETHRGALALPPFMHEALD